jgi:glutamate-ammonia-ligase adenylyltransferase
MSGKSPSRYGIWPELAPRLRKAGWLADGEIIDVAIPLLRAVRSGPDPEGALERIASTLEQDPGVAARTLSDQQFGLALVAIAGASRAFGQKVAAEPGLLPGPDDAAPPPPDLGATYVDDQSIVRRFVRSSMLHIAVRDLMAFDDLTAVGHALASLADQAAALALESAQREVRLMPRFAGLPDMPIAVIAMGKWGGMELNYSSDIDVLFVHGHPATVDGSLATDYARRVSTSFMAALSQVTADGSAYRVDAELRPEGRSGPLTRTVESYRSYYERWASTWEFQALIKARPAAGNVALGDAFMSAVEPFVYPETLESSAVREVREMKGRIEGRAVELGVDETEIKRGVGGIRDVEFAVQLLQLVHGRFDPHLRSANTLETLRTLADEGYVGRSDAEDMAIAYVWLRTLEHRIQLVDLRQTHTLPDPSSERERLAKAMGYRDGASATALDLFEADLVTHRSVVRTIHERLFYRPLLESFAASPKVALTPEGAARQLIALGFRDVDGARRAVGDLTTGLSRRSKLMQQTLPLLLEWLSRTPDPDLGLEQLRLLVTTTEDNTPLVAVLRDDPVAAERLCQLLGSSRVAGRFIDRIPRFLPELGDDVRLGRPIDAYGVIADAIDYVMLRPTYPRRLNALRRFVRGALLRILARDLLDLAEERSIARELADLADGAVAAALRIARDEMGGESMSHLPFAVIAMGKWGGRELGYPSDLDVLFVYDVPHGMDGQVARKAADELARSFTAALGKVTQEGVAYRVDAGLRPEGKDGPLARTLDGYRQYYERWAAIWEHQALIRARWAGGDRNLGEAFIDTVNGFSFPDPLRPDAIREIRTMKARIERERIPPGEDPDFHFKLGRGGLVDVEFLVQLLQMRNGAETPPLRAPATLEAIAGAFESGLLTEEETEHLVQAYTFCTRLRNRLYLQTGRDIGSLPTDPAELARLALLLGYPGGSISNLREDYRRATRRARRVFEQRFYED